MENIEIFLTPPPSLNKARMARKVNLGGGKQGARIQDTDVLRNWKATSSVHLTEQLEDVPKWVKEHVDKNGLFKFSVLWHGKHWFKNGNPKRRDLDNRIKFLMDQIFKMLQVDDCRVFELTLVKMPPQETPHNLADEDGEVCCCRVEQLEAVPQLS